MRRPTLETLALFAAAVAVRVLFPDANFFSTDQRDMMVEALGVLNGEWFPRGPGIGWTTFTLGPLYVWVTALGLLPRKELADLIVLVGVLHAAAVVGWRSLLAEVAGAAHAREVRLAGWALALSPVAINSGCGPISTSIVMPTTLIFVWGNVHWVRENSPFGFALACVGAALLVQSHITSWFILPLVLVGLWRRAPIGRVGLAGLAVAAAIAAPMVIYNLRAIDSSAFRHAGVSGAPFLVALFRAVIVEARVIELSAAMPDAWRAPAYATSLLWGAFIVVGAAVLLRRRGDVMVRSLFFFCFVVPTLCVVLIPRGAYLQYLDPTFPIRAWLFAIGVSALMATRSKTSLASSASIAAGLAALAAAVVPACAFLANRVAVADLGYVPVSISRVDLREPLGRSFESVGILTIGSQRALGRALADLGAEDGSLGETLHGPWRWISANSTGVWINESRRRRLSLSASLPRMDETQPSSATAHALGSASFLVRHESDRGAVPDSMPTVAGPFRVYAFDNRIKVTSAGDGRVVGTVEAGRSGTVTLQVVTEAAHGDAALQPPSRELAWTSAQSVSGFVVWSSSIGAGEATDVAFNFDQGERYIEQVRTPPDVYAFGSAQ